MGDLLFICFVATILVVSHIVFNKDLRKDKSAIEIQGKKQDLEAEVANLEDLRVAVNDQSSYAFNAS